MQRLAVIESYLDGCKFNEVGCGRRFPAGLAKGTDERDATQGGTEGRIEGPNTSFP